MTQRINKGDKVTYTNQYGTQAIGIVKSDDSPMDGFISVVFNCSNDWDNFDDCNGILVETDALHPGWDAEAVLKHYDVKPNINNSDDI